MNSNLDDNMDYTKTDIFEDEIRESYLEFSDNMPLPPANSFSRVMDNIDNFEAAQNDQIRQPILQQVFKFFHDTVQIRRMGWAMAGVQFAIILFIVFSQPSSNMENFQTLSINNVPESGMEINIVFKEDVLLKDIRALLNGSEAVIINGPTENGLYILKIKQGKDLTIRLKAIENSEIVKFVSKRL